MTGISFDTIRRQGAASPKATALNGVPSTSGWDVIYAINIPTMNSLLQSQYALAWQNAASNPSQPFTTQAEFPLEGGTGILYATDIQLGPPAIAVPNTPGAATLALSFPILSGSFVIAEQLNGGQSLLSALSIVPSAANTLSGTVPLSGGLQAQAIGFDIAGASAVATGLVLPNNAGNPFAASLMAALAASDYSADFPLGTLQLPLNDLYNPEMFDCAVQTTGGGDSGRLLYLIATAVDPAGGCSPPGIATTEINFVADTNDMAMVYGMGYILARMAAVLNANISGISFAPPVGQATAASAITLGTDLQMPGVSYSYGGSAGYDTEVSSELQGTSGATLTSCEIGILPAGSYAANPFGFYDATPSTSSTFQMNVSQSVNSVNQIIPSTCNIATTSAIAYTDGIAASSSGGSIQLQPQAGLTITPSFADTGDGSYNTVANYTDFDAGQCVASLTAPLPGFVGMLNAQMSGLTFEGLGTIDLPLGLEPQVASVALPADLIAQGASGAVPWYLSPEVLLLQAGTTQQFTPTWLYPNGQGSPPAAVSLSWTTLPANFVGGSISGGLFTTKTVTQQCTCVIVADDAAAQQQAYAVVTVVPATLTLNPQITVIAPGQSATIQAVLGTDVAPALTWSASDGTTITVDGATAVYSAATSLGVTVEMVTLTATPEGGGAATECYVVVADTRIACCAMTPLCGAVTNAGQLDLAITLPGSFTGALTWQCFPSGPHFGSVSAGNAAGSATYNAPISDLACPFTVYVLATDADADTLYGLALIAVTASS